MIKKLGIWFVLFSATAATAQVPDSLILQLRKTGRDTNKINTQLKLAEYYLHKPGEDKKDLDSSSFYIAEARSLSNALGAVDHQYRGLTLKAELSLEKLDYAAADSLFTAIINYYHAIGNRRKEAWTWSRYAEGLDFEDIPHLAIRRKSYSKAYALYKMENDKIRTAEFLGKIADADLNMGNYKLAEQELLSAIQQLKAIKYPRIYFSYLLLGETYFREGELQKSLLARIEAMHSYDNSPKPSVSDSVTVYFPLAVAYFRVNRYEQALLLYQKIVPMAVKLNWRILYYHCVNGVVNCYAGKKNYHAALTYLKKASQYYGVKTNEEAQIVLSAELRLYNLLHDEKSAGKIVPAFIRAFQHQLEELRSTTHYQGVSTFVPLYDPLIQYYTHTKQWGKLAAEQKKLEALPVSKVTVVPRIMIYQNRFRLDSASGNMLSALKVFQRIKTLQDSMTNIAVNQQIAELETRFLSVKKDKTIQALNDRTAVQQSRLEKINLERNITLAGVIFTIILAGLLYFAYRNKQRTNFRLRIKQEEINRQNNALSGLLLEKERLLQDKDHLLQQQQDLITDKEWLLKEVHHRVKNNLQIVMSLLYSQAAYLQNKDAMDAIRDSQNRVQAISIIHQKLYNESNVATVRMSDYVSDLVRHLCECYDCKKRKIKFDQQVEPLSFDPSQAVPMGLILNEAITNSIKYAFGDDGGGITIKGQLIEQDTIGFSIADNGRGLTADFDHKETSSLGMEMMRALSKQIGGAFEIRNDSGVLITLKFKLVNSLNRVIVKEETI